ncbi:unnamed protein product [Dovyalis caffra]|uniref:Uncharacterized protein n=1 Tax=Dovyalis caffra TaxID=77055 RepID=A0AAV1SRN5_9ROSI|nr:unnamed protein product [Dovyalis caffra]
MESVKSPKNRWLPDLHCHLNGLSLLCIKCRIHPGRTDIDWDGENPTALSSECGQRIIIEGLIPIIPKKEELKEDLIYMKKINDDDLASKGKQLPHTDKDVDMNLDIDLQSITYFTLSEQIIILLTEVQSQTSNLHKGKMMEMNKDQGCFVVKLASFVFGAGFVSTIIVGLSPALS